MRKPALDPAIRPPASLLAILPCAVHQRPMPVIAHRINSLVRKRPTSVRGTRRRWKRGVEPVMPVLCDRAVIVAR